MKKFFDKSNFIFAQMDKKQRRTSLVISLLIIFFFITSAFTFLNAFYGFIEAIGAATCKSFDVCVRDFLRNLPLIIVCLMNIWTLLLLQSLFRNIDENKLKKSLLKDSICLIAFGGFNILYILIGLISGQYLSIVEGSPSYIFPLDALLVSLFFVISGVAILVYEKKYMDKCPLSLVSHGNIVTKKRGMYATFVSFWLLFALFGFSAGVYSIFIYDFAHEHVFFGIATIYAYLLIPLFIGFWEFYFNVLNEDKKKEFLFPISILGISLSLISIVLYIVSLSIDRDAPSNAGFGMFPVAFAASVNLATLLMIIVPLVVSVVALIKSFLVRKN